MITTADILSHCSINRCARCCPPRIVRLRGEPWITVCGFGQTSHYGSTLFRFDGESDRLPVGVAVPDDFVAAVDAATWLGFCAPERLAPPTDVAFARTLGVTRWKWAMHRTTPFVVGLSDRGPIAIFAMQSLKAKWWMKTPQARAVRP